MRARLLAVAIVLAWPVGFQASAQDPQAPAPALAPPKQESADVPAKAREAYVIGPDDQIVVRVADQPDLSDKPQKVDPTGEIRLPMIGRVQAAGLTPEQLEAVLTERYKTFLREPDVLVSVTESRSQPVSVIGAVAQPGVRQLDGGKTLVQVLLAAGGTTPDAGPTVTVTRRIDRGRVPIPDAQDDPTGQFSIADIELRPLLEGRAPATDIVVQPNDIITISRAQVVFVIGEVGHAGPIPLVRSASMSVLEAVSSSGGVLRTAKPREARILRSTDGSDVRTEVPVDIQRIMAGKADDVALMAGDILVVPDSPGKRGLAMAFQAAIQAGVTIATYGLIR